jgi:hypothetical protein
MATTSTTSRPEPPHLQQLARRLKAWRATRTPGQRIPEDLWKGAADLARVHGLSRTATALRLSYYDLQRRLSGVGVPRRRRAPVTRFVELSPLPARPSEHGTLELIHACGARLTLRLPNAGPKDLLPIVDLFLRRRR